MAEIPVVKHNNPMKLADGSYHLYPTTIDLVKMPDGSTPAFDMESESWNAVDSMCLGGKPASEYATKEDLEGLPSSGSGVPNGGSAGQTLVKQSDEDGDAEWATPNLMDMEYVDPENETTDEEGNILLTDSDRLGGKPPEAYTAVNLLNNSAFEIAQAGHGGMHGDTRYAADRWILSNAKASVSHAKNSGLTVNKGDGETYIEQVLPINVNENAGKKYSFAVNADGIVNILHATMPNAVSLDIKNGNILLHSYSDGLLRLRIRVDSSITISWTALYEGKYTADTLPLYVAPDPVLELAKCQYYAQNLVFDIWTTMGESYTPMTGYLSFRIPIATMCDGIPDVVFPTSGLYIDGEASMPFNGSIEKTRRTGNFVEIQVYDQNITTGFHSLSTRDTKVNMFLDLNL